MYTNQFKTITFKNDVVSENVISYGSLTAEVKSNLCDRAERLVNVTEYHITHECSQIIYNVHSGFELGSQDKLDQYLVEIGARSK